MSVESALYHKLTNTAGVTAVFGSGADARIYPDQDTGVAPTLPYATFQVVSTRRSRHFAGITGTQLDFVRMQIDVYAATSLSRRTSAEAIRDALDGFAGSMGSEALVVRRVAVDGPDMSIERPEHDDELPLYRARMDVAIEHQ